MSEENKMDMNKLSDLNWKRISDEKPVLEKKCLVLRSIEYSLYHCRLFRRYDYNKKYNPDYFEWNFSDAAILSEHENEFEIHKNDLWVYIDECGLRNMITKKEEILILEDFEGIGKEI